DATFEWTALHEAALANVREALSRCKSQKILPKDAPKFVEIHILPESIDVSCLSPEGNLLERASKTLSNSEKNYTRVELNLLAIHLAYERFGTMLSNTETTFVTECKELDRVMTMKGRPNRVENLMLRLPAEAQPKFQFTKQSPGDRVFSIRLREKQPDAVFYIDGACYHNGKPDCRASWAVYVADHPDLSACGLVEQNPSNQTAEVTAGIKALTIAKENKFKEIVIISDNVEWIHVKGHSNDRGNEMADQMARSALSTPLLAFLRLTQDIQREDPDIANVIDNISKFRDRFVLMDDLLYHQRPGHEGQNPRLVVPTSQRHLLIQLAHDDQLYGGHLGCRKTTKKLDQFWWPSMAKDVSKYVQSCKTCQEHKVPKGPPPGHLHPIPVSRLFEQVHIDIIGPINVPSCISSRYIVTAIDAFSRYGFAKAKQQVKTEDCLEFIEEIIALHGTPERVVSDQGVQFTSNKWLGRMKDFGIKHQFTTAYHPQSNGMDERFNATLVKILRAYVSQHQTRWDEHLKWAIFVYNTSYQDSIKYSPYEVMYGCKPRTPLNLAPINPLTLAESRNIIRKDVFINSELAKARQKHYYDRNRKPVEFRVGQAVWIRRHVTPNEQASKFATKWQSYGIILKLPRDQTEEPRYAQVLDLVKSECKTVSIQDLKPYHLRSGTETYEIAENLKALRGAQSNSNVRATADDVYATSSPINDMEERGPVVVEGDVLGPLEHAPETEAQTRPVIIDLDRSQETGHIEAAAAEPSRRKQCIPKITRVNFEDLPITQTIDGQRDWLYRQFTTPADIEKEGSEGTPEDTEPVNTFAFDPEAGSTPQYTEQGEESDADNQ
ncbi:Ty3b-i, partial [Fragariocoptes setiger]